MNCWLSVIGEGAEEWEVMSGNHETSRIYMQAGFFCEYRDGQRRLWYLELAVQAYMSPSVNDGPATV